MELLCILVILMITHLPESLCVQNKKYDSCSKKLQCGYISNIGYPFYDGSTRPDYCGYPGFKLDCDQGTQQITISNHKYKLLEVNSYNIRVSNTEWSDGCPNTLAATTLDFSKFNFSSADQNITFFYGCPDKKYSNAFFETNCNFGGNGWRVGYYFTQDMLVADERLDMSSACNATLFLPVQQSQAQTINEGVHVDLAGLQIILQSGFELVLMAENDACGACTGSGGQCGYDFDSDNFVCHCADADYDTKCVVGSLSHPNSGDLLKKHISITASSAAITIVVLSSLVLFSYYFYHKYNLVAKNRSLEDCLKNYALLVSRRYTYASIKTMTRSFEEKLGEGGYGAVFKGSLKDGHAVAVKVSKQSKGDGQEFLNEVMSISRTSHVNVVPLLGFCFEGDKRALVYEFMPNGSLDKFIHERDFDDKKKLLSSQKLLDIVVGIARGLEYLHRGCNTRIVHFDIKPHNILLDAEFTPKISDFGLAKSFQQNKSIISLSGARGTAGYIAPEVFFRTFGGVTHKSDVYSFGMMVLEMVGCTKRVNQNVGNSSEFYFPQWIYKQLERGTAVICGKILNEEEKELERKMILVGLWCIQTNPLNRPAMSRVVEMLEGKVGLLQVPPMPTLASPPQQATEDGSAGTLLSSTPPSIIDHSHSVQNC